MSLPEASGLGNLTSAVYAVYAADAVHNVLFGQYVFLPTEQAETYLKIYVLIYH